MKRVSTVAAALAMTAWLSAAPSPSSVADAAMKGDRDAVRALLKQGADVSAARGDGMTALHFAAERGDAAMTEMLVYAGANVAAVTRIGQYTPLHVASRAGNPAVVQALLKAGRQRLGPHHHQRRHAAAPGRRLGQRRGRRAAARSWRRRRRRRVGVGTDAADVRRGGQSRRRDPRAARARRRRDHQDQVDRHRAPVAARSRRRQPAEEGARGLGGEGPAADARGRSRRRSKHRASCMRPARFRRRRRNRPPAAAVAAAPTTPMPPTASTRKRSTRRSRTRAA